MHIIFQMWDKYYIFASSSIEELTLSTINDGLLQDIYTITYFWRSFWIVMKWPLDVHKCKVNIWLHKRAANSSNILMFQTNKSWMGHLSYTFIILDMPNNIKGCGMKSETMADISILNSNLFVLYINLIWLQCAMMHRASLMVIRSGSHTTLDNVRIRTPWCI